MSTGRAEGRLTPTRAYVRTTRVGDAVIVGYPAQ